MTTMTTMTTPDTTTDTTTTARPRIILARHGQDGRALGFDSQGRPWVRGPTTASGRPARWVRAVCVPV